MNPITLIFSPKKGISSLVAVRLQRWAILLSAYDYDVQCHSTSQHNNDNMLSHLFLATPANIAVLLELTIFNVR